MKRRRGAVAGLQEAGEGLSTTPSSGAFFVLGHRRLVRHEGRERFVQFSGDGAVLIDEHAVDEDLVEQSPDVLWRRLVAAGAFDGYVECEADDLFEVGDVLRKSDVFALGCCLFDADPVLFLLE